MQPPHIRDIAANVVSKVLGPLKVKIIMWFALLEQLPTIDYLAHPNICPPFVCVLCKSQTEPVSHIILDCPYSMVIWNVFKQESTITSWLPSI